MRDEEGQKGQTVVPSSSSSSNQKDGCGLEVMFGRGKYKLWALAAITLLALWSMFTATAVTRNWSDVNLKHDDPSSLHSDLDVLVPFPLLITVFLLSFLLLTVQCLVTYCCLLAGAKLV